MSAPMSSAEAPTAPQTKAAITDAGRERHAASGPSLVGRGPGDRGVAVGEVEVLDVAG